MGRGRGRGREGGRDGECGLAWKNIQQGDGSDQRCIVAESEKIIGPNGDYA